MAKITFIDEVCPKPYTCRTLEETGQGGTESTVTRVAMGLASEGHTVTVVQPHHTVDYTWGKVTKEINGLITFTDKHPTDYQNLVVALRAPQTLIGARKIPAGKYAIWLHDFNHNDVIRNYEHVFKGNDTHMVCVSDTHKQVTLDALLNQLDTAKGIKLRAIYNPIDNCFKETYTARTPKTLLYCSSPHKGLKRTLEAFEAVKRRDPEYRLTICNPGYYELPEGVKGATVTPEELAALMNNHSALFHMNAYPETFGLVYGEAIACGLPILTGRSGAAVNELVKSDDCFVDINNDRAIIERLEKWNYYGAPNQGLNSKFRIKAVVAEWEKLIHE